MHDHSGLIVPFPAPTVLSARLFTPTPKAAKRVLEFFTTQINNDHTRKAYLNATRRSAQWCEAHNLLHSLRRTRLFLPLRAR